MNRMYDTNDNFSSVMLIRCYHTPYQKGVSDMKCQVIDPEKRDVCGAQASLIITFRDNTHARACQKCALHLQEVAKDVRSSVRIYRLNSVAA